jgi:hypothetical protein
MKWYRPTHCGLWQATARVKMEYTEQPNALFYCSWDLSFFCCSYRGEYNSLLLQATLAKLWLYKPMSVCNISLLLVSAQHIKYYFIILFQYIILACRLVKMFFLFSRTRGFFIIFIRIPTETHLRSSPGSQMAVRLSAPRAGRPLPPRKIPGTHFC